MKISTVIFAIFFTFSSNCVFADAFSDQQNLITERKSTQRALNQWESRAGDERKGQVYRRKAVRHVNNLYKKINSQTIEIRKLEPQIEADKKELLKKAAKFLKKAEKTKSNRVFQKNLDSAKGIIKMPIFGGVSFLSSFTGAMVFAKSFSSSNGNRAIRKDGKKLSRKDRNILSGKGNCYTLKKNLNRFFFYNELTGMKISSSTVKNSLTCYM